MKARIHVEYLAQVINEALRLKPPVPIDYSQVIIGDTPLADWRVIAANTFVVTAAYVSHRLKEYWDEDADKLKPERW